MQWVRNLCRLCGEIGEVCYHLFDPNLRLDLKVKRCLNLDITEEDYKPKEICGLCHNKINDFLHFIDTTVTTSMKFESMYYSNNYYMNDKYPHLMPYTDNNYKQSVIVSNRQQPNKPSIENPDVIPYIGYEHDIQPDMVNLFDCAEKQMGQSEFLPYNSDSTNLVSVDAIKKSISGPTQPKQKKIHSYKCPHCDKTFLRRLNLTSHISKHTNIKNFQCPSCPKAFAVKTLLTQHRKVHSELHRCHFCHKGFQSPSKLSRHMLTHELNKQFVCPLEGCHKEFSERGNLNQHMKSHNSERTFRCHLCDKLFKTQRHLRAHVINHARDSQFVCVYCNKAFKYKHNLKSHLVKHRK